MVGERRALVEFVVLAGLVALAGVGLVALSITGVSDSPVITTLQDIVKVGFGAIIALAYAARGVVRKGGPGGGTGTGGTDGSR